MSKVSSVDVATKGCFKSITLVSYGKYSLTSTPFTVIDPLPGTILTCATEDFLRPVPINILLLAI